MGFSAQQYHPELPIYTTVWQYRLGIAKPKNVFRLILPSSCYEILKIVIFYWCLQPSVTQQWKGLHAWFLSWSTSLHPEMCLFANCSACNAVIHVSWTYLCPRLCSSSFCWQRKVSICNSMIWLPTGFVMLFSCILKSDLDSLQRSFLHWCSFLMLCN